MERLTTENPQNEFEIMMNYFYGKDGWAYIRHDGEHENVRLTDWAKRQCMARGCADEDLPGETPEEIDVGLCDCMMDIPICPIALAYCFASQAVHLRDRLKQYEDTGLEPEEVAQIKLALMGKALTEIKEFDGIPIARMIELAQAEKDGRLVVVPCKLHESIFYLEDGEWFDDVPYEVIIGQRQGERRDSLLFSCEDGFDFYGEDIGEAVFLTREEAEAALKKRVEADNEAD